jgi:transcriptional/translational regulatory protein YebC/TACO1
MVLEKAKQNNMRKTIIDRAIQSGLGKESTHYEQITFDGVGGNNCVNL